jgi:hypothetical protein
MVIGGCYKFLIPGDSMLLTLLESLFRDDGVAEVIEKYILKGPRHE